MNFLRMVAGEEGGGLDNALLRKLDLFCRLSRSDRASVCTLLEAPHRRIAARHDIIREGERQAFVLVVLDGWAARYKTLADGRRQIISLFLPGDICDAHSYLLKASDHSIGAITRLRIATVSHSAFEELVESSHRLCQAMRWQELVNMAVQQEWTLNVGQRTATERIGHFLCETFYRLKLIGLTQGDSCDFPIVQNDLADIVGLTPVHVNRTLQELRRSGLIVLENRRLTLPDRARLEDMTLFNPNYLHAGREGAHLDAND